MRITDTVELATEPIAPLEQRIDRLLLEAADEHIRHGLGITDSLRRAGAAPRDAHRLTRTLRERHPLAHA